MQVQFVSPETVNYITSVETSTFPHEVAAESQFALNDDVSFWNRYFPNKCER